MNGRPVVGRIAPSPTGALHLGHALSFLAAWWSARSQGGRIVLRLEDIDDARAQREHIEGTLRDLTWLGLNWDGDPLLQSTRREPLVNAAHQLLLSGRAYPCTCTRSQLSAANRQDLPDEPIGAPQQGVRELKYSGHCRGLFRSIEEAESKTGRAAGLRLRVEPEKIEFHDSVYGTHRCNVGECVGDFLVLRRNKTPAYQLAVVVDDHLDKVTEVVRGRDLLDSTARQILVARALGYTTPRYVHIPLVCDINGRRLAKRERDLGLHDLRSSGISSQQVIRWAARALGQTAPDNLVHPSELSEKFQVMRISSNDICLAQDPLSTFQ